MTGLHGYSAGDPIPGAWLAVFAAPIGLHPNAIADTLRTATVAVRLPVTATIRTDGYGPTITLYRDPSRTHGTPTPADAAAMADYLARATGWQWLDTPRAGLIVPLGLREGYDRRATVHDPQWVAAIAPQVVCRAATFVAARVTDGGLRYRYWDEPCVEVYATARDLPAIARAADACRQHRFVVTDLDADTTRVYTHHQHGQETTRG